MDLGRMILAALMMSSMVTLPLCLMFFTFFRSRGGSFSALITSAAAEGTTVTCTKQNPHSLFAVMRIRNIYHGSRFLIFFYPSRIPDPKTSTKEG
jgi:hypothetical protein